MWEFAIQNPFTALMMCGVLAWAVVEPFRYAALAYNRRLRAKNIAAHGWPTQEFMDADGDLVYPDPKPTGE